MPELIPSQLGEKSYWDKCYEREIKNFKETGDIGEVWFGQDPVEKMIDWIQDNIPLDASIMDIGCGNGHLLLELEALGFTQLLGTDYSAKAIALAESVSEGKQIQYQCMDILNPPAVTFTVLLDKGTFDAICLSTNDPNVYVKNVHDMLIPGGFLVITSCNWTFEELVERFNCLTVYKRIKYPTFQFGGVQGSKVTTIVFQK